eukprot:Phypoly_transcript_11441.p1 GENE.Phypoly_transcript_11441~~Phypoly_transcript_11441.p1  ORF type:complete len:233 (+),score=32.00 Phypoly_transcript_11441:489-1187(+)
MWTFDEELNQWSLQGHYENMKLSGGSLACNENLVYFGGISPSKTYSSVTYIFDEASNSWNLAQNTGPNGRIWTPPIYVPSPYRETFIFGGFNGSQHSDFWSLGSQWKNIQEEGAWPHARSGQVMVYDPARKSILMFGGEDSDKATIDDLWIFSLQARTWELVLLENQPRGRLGAGAAQTGTFTLIFGGVTGWTENDKLVNEVWVLHSRGSLICQANLFFVACTILFLVVFVL